MPTKSYTPYLTCAIFVSVELNRLPGHRIVERLLTCLFVALACLLLLAACKNAGMNEVEYELRPFHLTATIRVVSGDAEGFPKRLEWWYLSSTEWRWDLRAPDTSLLY